MTSLGIKLNSVEHLAHLTLFDQRIHSYYVTLSRLDPLVPLACIVIYYLPEL